MFLHMPRFLMQTKVTRGLSLKLCCTHEENLGHLMIFFEELQKNWKRDEGHIDILKNVLHIVRTAQQSVESVQVSVPL